MSVGKLYERAAQMGMGGRDSHFVRYDGLNDETDFSRRTCLPISGYEGEDIVEVL